MTEEKQRRGFACLTPEQRKEMASKGGKSLAPGDRYYSVNRAAARKAGRKGGKADHIYWGRKPTSSPA